MGSMSHQIRLLSVFESYERAQRAAEICPHVRDQQDKADQIYTEMVRIAMSCGFEPGGQHRAMSTYEFAKQRAAALRRWFPAHVREAKAEGQP